MKNEFRKLSDLPLRNEKSVMKLCYIFKLNTDVLNSDNDRTC